MFLPGDTNASRNYGNVLLSSICNRPICTQYLNIRISQYPIPGDALDQALNAKYFCLGTQRRLAIMEMFLCLISAADQDAPNISISNIPISHSPRRHIIPMMPMTIWP